MGDILGSYRGYMGMMEKKMEATIMGLYGTRVNIGTRSFRENGKEDGKFYFGVI